MPFSSKHDASHLHLLTLPLFMLLSQSLHTAAQPTVDAFWGGAACLLWPNLYGDLGHEATLWLLATPEACSIHQSTQSPTV